jgi:hypothetical protein
MAPYRYTPLKSAKKEIRLIHLVPGEFTDPLKMRIVHAPLPLPSTAPHVENVVQLDSLRGLFSRPWTIEETEGGELLLFNVTTGESQVFGTVAASSADDAAEYEPRYDALSYTWGHGDISEVAHVQYEAAPNATIETWDTLGLRQNLASAMRHFRDRSDTRILWIDALCINQEDMDERNEQVKRMADIYVLANHVVAWLGEESDDSGTAIAALQHIGQQLETTKSGRIIAAPNATEPYL